MTTTAMKFVASAIIGLAVQACALEEPRASDTLDEDREQPLPQLASAPESEGHAPNATDDERGTFTSDCNYGQYATGFVSRAGNRVLSVGTSRWVLFDTVSRRVVASGPRATGVPVSSGLAGNTAIVSGVVEREGVVEAQGLMLLDARDGRVITLMPIDGRVIHRTGLALDGSYFWLASDRQITTWSADGRPLGSVTGTYQGAQIIATPEKLYVLNNPPDQQLTPLNGRVDNVSTNAALSEFNEQRLWSIDGRYYYHLVSGGERLGIFNPDHTLAQQVGPVPGARFSVDGATGEYYWGSDGSGRIAFYRVHGSVGEDRRPVPLLSVGYLSTKIVPSRSAVLLVDARLTVLDLRGDAPTQTVLQIPSSTPLGYDPRPQFSADQDGRWVVMLRGLIYVGEPGSDRMDGPLGCRAP